MSKEVKKTPPKSLDIAVKKAFVTVKTSKKKKVHKGSDNNRDTRKP